MIHDRNKWPVPNANDGWVAVTESLPKYNVPVDVWIPIFGNPDDLDTIIEHDYVLKAFNIGQGTDIAFQSRTMHEHGLYEYASKLSEGHVTHWRPCKQVVVGKEPSNNVHHIANKRHKKTIKQLQRRLAEEQRDAKRLTMLLVAAQPTTTAVLKDLIDAELNEMRYRYHLSKDDKI